VAEHEGLLMVNPGSPTQKRYQPNATFAIVTVKDMVEARLLIVD
jgi:predicted phosphodiesterase